MSCWVSIFSFVFVLPNYVFYILFYFLRGTGGGFMRRHGNVKGGCFLFFVFFYCFFFVCTVTTHCFRASDSLLNLCCVIVPVFFSLSLFFILNHSFLLRCQPGVGAAALLVTTTIVWLCLLIFNIETIKPLAPQLDSLFFIGINPCAFIRAGKTTQWFAIPLELFHLLSHCNRKHMFNCNSIWMTKKKWRRINIILTRIYK